jgi:UDP-glucose 4-epimerase
MQLNGKSFLVIGGAGFIGSHVVSELLRHDVRRVIIYDNFARGKLSNINEQLKDARCEIFKDGGDLREIEVLSKAMEGIDGVFHLAALWLLHCNDFPRTAFDVNIQGTFNVLEACVKNNVSKLVYSSSASVYGDAETIPMTESHPFNNKNFYGATKIAGEAMCRSFADRYGLKFIGLRYMNVYGPHQDQSAAYTGVIPIMLNKIEENSTPIINGDGSQAYDFVDVRDVARCNILAMQSDVSDEFYNVGTGVQTSIAELCDEILKLCKSALKVEYRDYSAEDKRRFVQNRIGAIEKAENEIGFRFSISLSEGLKDLIRWRASDHG